jgi:hypothetical protein
MVSKIIKYSYEGNFKMKVIKYAEQRNNCQAVRDVCLQVEATRTEIK